MRQVLAAGLVALTLVAACGGREDESASESASAADASDALQALFDEHFEKGLEMNPLRATRIGDDRFDDRLAITNSAEYREQAREMDEEFLARLLEIDRNALGEQEKLSYDMFRIMRERSLEGNQYPSHLQPVNQFYLLTSSFARLGSGASAHRFETVKNYDDFLSRADDFVVNVDHVIEKKEETEKTTKAAASA